MASRIDSHLENIDSNTDEFQSHLWGEEGHPYMSLYRPILDHSISAIDAEDDSTQMFSVPQDPDSPKLTRTSPLQKYPVQYATRIYDELTMNTSAREKSNTAGRNLAFISPPPQATKQARSTKEKNRKEVLKQTGKERIKKKSLSRGAGKRTRSSPKSKKISQDENRSLTLISDGSEHSTRVSPQSLKDNAILKEISGSRNKSKLGGKKKKKAKEQPTMAAQPSSPESPHRSERKKYATNSDESRNKQKHKDRKKEMLRNRAKRSAIVSKEDGNEDESLRRRYPKRKRSTANFWVNEGTKENDEKSKTESDNGSDGKSDSDCDYRRSQSMNDRELEDTFKSEVDLDVKLPKRGKHPRKAEEINPNGKYPGVDVEAIAKEEPNEDYTKDVMTDDGAYIDFFWNLRFRELLAYKKKYESTIVPRDKKFKTLFTFCQAQRWAMTHKTIHPDRFRRLNSVGFVWIPQVS